MPEFQVPVRFEAPNVEEARALARMFAAHERESGGDFVVVVDELAQKHVSWYPVPPEEAERAR